MGESDLEDALLDRLQAFMLELGHGFCFEARQKPIQIGDTTCFIDLVFYHRILKCHVLIELKVADFSHEHLGQLNTYVSWYKRNMITYGDSPPIGLLLCKRKDNALFNEIMDSQKKFAERAVRWDLDTNVNRRMDYNFYFGKAAAKPAAKKA